MSDKQLKIRIKIHGPSSPSEIASLPTEEASATEQFPSPKYNINVPKVIGTVCLIVLVATVILFYTLRDPSDSQAELAALDQKETTSTNQDEPTPITESQSGPTLSLYDPAEFENIGTEVAYRDTVKHATEEMFSNENQAQAMPTPEISLPVLDDSPPTDKGITELSGDKIPSKQGVETASTEVLLDASKHHKAAQVKDIATNSASSADHVAQTKSARRISIRPGINAERTRASTDLEKPYEPALKLKTVKNNSEYGSTVVARAQLTNGIKQREPIDRLESVVDAEGRAFKRLFYFTEIRNMKGGTITHLWKHQGKVVAKVKFPIRGNRWRIYSSKNLTSSMIGEWQIDVLDTQGKPLTTANFVYTES